MLVNDVKQNLYIMRILIVLFVLYIPQLVIAQHRLGEQDELQIKETFFKTESAWNNADIDGSMEGYWKSEKLTFVGSKGLTYGWESTRERYMKGYPDKTAMGKLRFTILELSKIEENSALMIGKFYLSRSIGDMQGHFTLVWKKIDGYWVIISDHSSSSN